MATSRGISKSGGISPVVLERAVCAVAAKIAPTGGSRTSRQISERHAFVELAACILGSRVKFEDALAAALRLRKFDLIDALSSRRSRSNLLREVRKVLRGGEAKAGLSVPRYRFWSSRSEYIVDTALCLYARGEGILPILKRVDSQQEARKAIVSVSRGIGPKQASLFLRNMGWGNELAILDTHVLNFMIHLGLLHKMPGHLSSFGAYEKIEQVLRTYAQAIGWTLDVLDQAIWITMRVARGSAV